VDDLLSYRRNQRHRGSAQARGDIKGPDDTEKAIKRSRLAYILWWAFMPSAIAFATLGVLCARECTALPWLTFLIAPVISIVLGMLGAIAYWVWSSRLPPEDRRGVRWLIASSVLWGPVVAYVGFAITLVVAQPVVGVFSLFFS
jgi:hypothetical protein